VSVILLLHPWQEYSIFKKQLLHPILSSLCYTLYSMLTYKQIIDFLAAYGFTPHNVAPLVVLAIGLYFFIKRDFKEVSRTIQYLTNRVTTIEHCIIEIQTLFKAKFTNISFQHTIQKYGQTNSPIVLKNEFKKFITVPKLDIQIQKQKDALVAWILQKKPKTGLDDLTAYKQNLYENGKTSEDAVGILGVYLFGILIPELDLPDGRKKLRMNRKKG